MKVTLTFDLPEDRNELWLAIEGCGWMSVVLDMDNWLRSQIKHGHTFQTAGDALDEARGMLAYFQQSNQVDLDRVE